MSRVEIVSKTGNLTLGVIDDLTGTVEMTEEWKQILQQRKPADEQQGTEPETSDSEDDEEDEGEDEEQD